MPTFMKVDEETKSMLEELQAGVKLETEQKVTKQELLDRSIRRKSNSGGALGDPFGKSKLPLSEEKAKQYMSHTISCRGPIDREDVARTNYDEEQA